MTKASKHKTSQSKGTLRSSANNRLAPVVKHPTTKKTKTTTAKKQKHNKKQDRSAWKRLALWGFKWSFIGGVWLCVVIALAFVYFSATLPDIKQITIVDKKPSITIVTETGTTLAKYGDEYGEFADYKDLPPHLINAVVSIEDQRFFDHFGIDILGLVRAFYVNYRAGHVVQGGSTITQQLAKISFLTPERTVIRKMKEVVLALWLEHKLSKQQILSIYLNKVYLGSGNYGVSAASRYYFGKRVQDININEAAILAGLLKAPTKYSPANNPDLAKKRAELVLNNMVSEGYLTESQKEQEARFRPAAIDRGVKETLKNPYFADWILEQLPEYVGSVTSDVTITTTLDMRMQQAAENILSSVLSGADNQGALVALSPQGKVLAMVGGKNYYKSQFNRAVKAKRQPGSTFKMFVYLSAFEHGYGPFDRMSDAPIRIKNWSPQNYSGRHEGNLTLLDAFARSINTVAVRLSETVGRDNVIALARRMGIRSNMESIPSIALGSSEVSVLEITTAYAHLANNGLSVQPYGIVEVKDKTGNILYHHQPAPQERVISRDAVASMNNLMVNVIDNGTGKAARLNRQAGGKTGTSQDFRDAWFVGYTPNLVTGVWVGNDDNTPMKGITGGKFPAQIWKGFMTQALANQPVLTLPVSAYAVGKSPREQQERKSLWDELLNIFGGNDTGRPAARAPIEYH